VSLLKKLKKGLNKAAKLLPAAALLAPNSKGLATAAQTLQMVGGAVQGGGIPGLSTFMPGAPQVGGLPSFPMLPSGGASSGGIVKTGLPVLAAAGTALVRAAPAIVAGGRAALARISPKVAKALGWATVGGLVYDAAGNLQGKASTRRMNPLNPRAARRAIRRIKSVRKVCNSIERSLPKQKSRGSCGGRGAHRH